MSNKTREKKNTKMRHMARMQAIKSHHEPSYPVSGGGKGINGLDGGSPNEQTAGPSKLLLFPFVPLDFHFPFSFYFSRVTTVSPMEMNKVH